MRTKLTLREKRQNYRHDARGRVLVGVGALFPAKNEPFANNMGLVVPELSPKELRRSRCNI